MFSVATITSSVLPEPSATPTVLASGCPTIIGNGLPIATITTPIIPHKRKDKVHGGVVMMGSANVMCNGKSIAHICSPISCGAFVISGLPTIVTT